MKSDPFHIVDDSMFTKVQVKVGGEEFAKSIGKGGFQLEQVAE